MKLVNFRCKECSYEEEEIYQDTEEINKTIGYKCPMCFGEMKKWNIKNNSQVWKFMDQRK